MAQAMSDYPELDVSWLCSGRQRDQLGMVDMAFDWRRGLTFATRAGKVRLPQTVLDNNIFQLLRDINSLDLRDYDLLVSDYEPVIAWAAKKQQRECLGIGHQYAFAYSVPQPRAWRVQKTIMSRFAPVTQGVGLHWDSFGQPILPPIVELPEERGEVETGKIVVYLPFEDQCDIIARLREIKGARYFIYGPGLVDKDLGNLQTRALSRQGFKADLVTAEGVICNTGFELISECLTLGIKILTRPLGGQVEQQANALALQTLGYATVTERWCLPEIKHWLHRGGAVRINYPLVHQRLAGWIDAGRKETLQALSDELWQGVTVHQAPCPRG